MRPRRRDEGGAVAILTAICLVLVVTAAAFAVDLGMQRVVRSDMQALADAVALDAARLLDGRTAGDVRAGSDGRPSLASVVEASWERNKDSALGDVDEPETRLVTLVEDDNGAYEAAPGEVADGDIPDAVVVTVSGSVGFAFSTGSGGATRSAIGTNQHTACFSLGSFAAAVDGGDAQVVAALNGLLGVDLTLASYQALANADVTLDQLAATGQAGTVDQLLTGSVTIASVYAATVAALDAEGDDAAVTAMNGLVGAVANLGQPLVLGNVLAVDPDDDAALGVDIKVLDLVAGTALVANGTNAVAVPSLSAGTATVGTATSTLAVTQRAQIACGAVGEATARTSQVSGTLVLPLTLPNVNGFTATTTGAVLTVGAGDAEGTLTSPVPACASGTAAAPDTLNVAVTADAATLSAAVPLHLKKTVLVPYGLGTLSVDVSFDVDIPASVTPLAAGSGTAALSVPPNDDTPESIGNAVQLSPFSTAGTPTKSNFKVELTGGGSVPGALAGTVSAVVDPLVSTTLGLVNTTVVGQALNPLISSLNTDLLGPLSTLLGVKVSGADVFAVGRPACESPRIAG